MKRLITYIHFGLILGAMPALLAQDTTNWRTEGLEIQLAVNGGEYETFFAKGVAYSPAPVGDAGPNAHPNNDFFYRHPDLPDTVDQYRAIWKRDLGTTEEPGLLRQLGVNSIRLYSMLKHGYSDIQNVDKLDWSTNKPPVSEWQTHYGHDAFLDMCWNGGVDPVYVWVCVPFNDSPFGYAGTEGEKETKRKNLKFFNKTAEWLAKSYGDHPAVIGFILGNEHTAEAAFDTALKGTGIIQTRLGPVDFSNADVVPPIPSGGWPPEVIRTAGGGHLERIGQSDVYQGVADSGTTWRKSYWDKLNAMHDIIKEHAPNKLTASSMHDDPNILIHWLGEVDEAAGTVTVIEQTPREYSKIDVWGFNAYNIPDADSGTAFPRYQRQVVEYAEANDMEEIIRPILLTELGVPASTRQNSQPVELPDNAEAAAELIMKMWDAVADNRVDGSLSGGVSSGAFLFEFSDEWHKAGNPTAHNGSSGGSDFFPGFFWDEEWFGLYSVAPSPNRGPNPNKGQDASTPLAQRDVINEATGDLNGGPDILTPRAIVGMLKAAFTGSNPLQAGGAVPLQGAADGVHQSDWYGVFYDGLYPWVYSYAMGWQYWVGNSDETLFIFDDAIGWCYTNEDAFPSLYSYVGEQWFYYDFETDTYYSFLTELTTPDGA